MIFVFGSNLAGRHGKGAALYAMKHHGAQYGNGVGPQGNSYAIPTKCEKMKTLTLERIRDYIHQFVIYAEDNPDKDFALTPVGTGLAGHSKRDIWAILVNVSLPTNVYLCSSWVQS